MSNIKHPKNPNPRGSVNIALGDLMLEVRQIAAQENRSINRQLAVIVREWLAEHKAKSAPAPAQTAAQ